MKKLFTLLSLFSLILVTIHLPLSTKGMGNSRSKHQMRKGFKKFKNNNQNKKIKSKQNKKTKKKIENFLELQPVARHTPIENNQNIFRVAYGMEY